MDLNIEPLGRIEAVEAVFIRLPLLHPFETSFGVKTAKEALLLRVASEGLEAWSECIASPDPFYSYETITTALHVIRDFLLPAALRATTIGEMETAFRHVRGHRMAKAALENAFLNLAAQRRGLPLHDLLGAERKKIPAGVSFGIAPDIDRLLETVARAAERGFRKVKLKIKRGRDHEVLSRVRERFPDLPLAVDANADYTLADLDVLKSLDPLRLLMIEQPLSHDDLWDHARLQRHLETPVCLDESVESLDDAAAAIAMGSCRIINIKQGRVGGLLESRRIASLGMERGVGVWSGAVIESGIGRAYNLHLQTLPNFVYPGDNSGAVRAFEEDLTEPGVDLDAEGCVEIAPGPGLGFQVVAERVQRWSTWRTMLHGPSAG